MGVLCQTSMIQNVSASKRLLGYTLVHTIYFLAHLFLSCSEVVPALLPASAPLAHFSRDGPVVVHLAALADQVRWPIARKNNFFCVLHCWAMVGQSIGNPIGLYSIVALRAQWQQQQQQQRRRRRRRLAAFGLRRAACGLRPAACGLRPAACGLRPSTCGLRPAACGGGGSGGSSSNSNRSWSQGNAWTMVQKLKFGGGRRFAEDRSLACFCYHIFAMLRCVTL